MSDFLLNLARRGAGVATAAQSRLLPPPEIATAPRLDAAPAVPVVAPAVHSAPVDVIQRDALPPPVAPSSALAAVVSPVSPQPTAPTVAPARTENEPAAGRDADLPAVLPVTTPVPELRPQTLPDVAAAEALVEHHITTRVIELVPAAVAVAPRAERSEPRVAASVRAEPQAPPGDRLVHVHIGAIEILGSSGPAPLAPAPPAPPAQDRAQGFDDFSSLRTYAPFRW